MPIRVKQKKFGPVFLTYSEAGTISYGMTADSVDSPHPPALTPVDTLLASLGACIIKSIEWSAGQKKADLHPYAVTVSGLKAGDLPNRIERLDIRVSAALTEDPDLAADIVKQAKSICTVSNSLNCEVTLSLEAEG